MGENQKLPFFNSLRRNMTKWDMVALGVFLFLVGWYIYAVQTGMGIPDEGFYDTITQRLGMGDRLFVDEWHVSQLFSLFLYIPYQIFFHLNGSNDGVIIFIRIFTVVVTMPMYWYIYCKLREHKLFAVIAALLFWACFPGGLIVLNYMVIPVYAMMIACLILFTAKDPLPWWKLIVAGLAVSCAVVDMPLIALIYLLFSILCLVRKCKPQLLKNYGFILNSKTWIGITIGCAIAFVIVVGGIAIKSGVANIIETFPELLTDSEYDFSIVGGHTQRFFFKIFDATRLYGVSFTCLAVIVCVLSAVCCRFGKSKQTIRSLLTIGACLLVAAQVVFAVFCIHNYYTDPNAYGYDAPGYALFLLYGTYFSFATTIFGLSCYLLCEKKDPRVFAFWLTGTLMSLCEMYGAEVTMSLGGPISNVTMLICLKQLWEEGKTIQYIDTKKRKSLTTAKREKRRAARGKAMRGAIVVALCATTIWGCINFYPEGIRPYVEAIASDFSDKKISQRLTTGPYKGIRTSAPLKKVYENVLADLDEIAADSNGEAFYVAGICPYYYLYLEAPIGTYSTWYVERDSETRQLRYWELHPEKRPKYYYVPLYSDGLSYTMTWKSEKERIDEKIKFIKSISECTVKKGRAGYIVKINDWKQ